MALHDPVAVYNAANNVEAHLVRNALANSGVDAFVTEDVSQVGTWMFGLIPEIHKPQVWVEKTDVERAKPILDDYERRSAELRDNSARDEAQAGPDVEIACEECGQRSAFPAAQRGSVQQCKHCGAYVDVEDERSSEEWAESQGDEEVTGES
jgi:hypothetical protein